MDVIDINLSWGMNICRGLELSKYARYKIYRHLFHTFLGMKKGSEGRYVQVRKVCVEVIAIE